MHHHMTRGLRVHGLCLLWLQENPFEPQSLFRKLLEKLRNKSKRRIENECLTGSHQFSSPVLFSEPPAPNKRSATWGSVPMVTAGRQTYNREHFTHRNPAVLASPMSSTASSPFLWAPGSQPPFCFCSALWPATLTSSRLQSVLALSELHHPLLLYKRAPSPCLWVQLPQPRQGCDTVCRSCSF